MAGVGGANEDTLWNWSSSIAVDVVAMMDRPMLMAGGVPEHVLLFLLLRLRIFIFCL
eukprot:CAMPEP_0172567822 /NCGR_PEP_ID=MMETSP1067-20121228/117370_1 /TAXON_ID=265564 ORGANISM="Thalassiosira punctigera, Strain Tpunct2005C2" /NCGR_SAMPLE_ID=MMETSP1067 /ASSEMBLY_ACC=CAM_ASM_000444 /LENGTH=56 /DNA_ID=CAMNT_0013359261 /DNA_START=60 /DNA_END=227 /DNA_ORIENTATION=-